MREDQILKITNPRKLFPGGEQEAKALYRKLVRAWHPDYNPYCDHTVLAHINTLYAKLACNNKIDFKALDGKEYSLSFLKETEFELGKQYTGERTVAYFVDNCYGDLFDNGVKFLSSFKYADAEMKKEISRYFPTIKAVIKTKDYHVVILEKTPDVLSLRDILNHFNGAIDPRHVGWIINRLYGIAAYFQWADIVHNALSLDSIFISPQYHTALPIGGWWYSSIKDAPLIALPAYTLNTVPSSVIERKVARPAIDSFLIKSMGLHLLGDVNGTSLRMKPDIPQATVNWLMLPGTDDLLQEFKVWNDKVLLDSFGPKKFVELNVTQDDLY